MTSPFRDVILRSMNKDVTTLVKNLRAQGFDVKRTKNSHWVVYRPHGGAWVATLPSTPSDHRGLRNATNALVKHGFAPRSP